MNFLKEHPYLDLNGTWFYASGRPLSDDEFRSRTCVEKMGFKVRPCPVPGNYEIYLQEAGLLEDPRVGTNVLQLRALEHNHLWLWRTFLAENSPEHEAFLTFEGIDCFADIYLNGELLGRTDNMLIEHTFDVTGRFRAENELFVHIWPAREKAKQFDYPPGIKSDLHTYDGLYVRKAPHGYGWDIMPRALSMGVWRPVKLWFRPQERLERVFLAPTSLSADHRRASHKFYYRARTCGTPDDRYEIQIEGICGESQFKQKQPLYFDAGRMVFDVIDPLLWQPRGRGEPNLYKITVRLFKNGSEIDALQFHHGIRIITLEKTSLTDEKGQGEFCFRVNNERVFIKGTNWVPLDAFHSRDAAKTEMALKFAEDLECNMIRCWGGNVYESDAFFDYCDQAGILVWQDFAMACAIYPHDADFCQRLETEARSVVRRLRQHPSLALWAGDNECDETYFFEGRNPNTNVLTRQVLPRVLWEEDPWRPFHPSSPYMDESVIQTGRRFLPEEHLWGPRGYHKNEFFTHSLCHFTSEIGCIGCPAPESIRRFITPENLWPWQNNKEWLLHGTSPVPANPQHDYRVPLMASLVREFFGKIPDQLESFAFASQVVQAEAFKFYIEFFRSQKWRKTGILWWNLIDGWPQFSEAVVDYYGVKKLAYHFIRTAQQPLCLMFREPDLRKPGDWGQDLIASNDRREAIPLTFTVRDIDSGDILAEGRQIAAPDNVTPIARISFSYADKRFYIIEWETERGETGRNHYLTGYPPFNPDQYRKWLTAAGLYLAEECP
ncbi:beta-galactosidase/beta-glucuronidase [Candidatus Vecturithrix granuli]|uniref:beta-mannosidase n=1 Tax=Vecturithrix granuli TaxID=1499967 RepID=A0A0S6WC46_VECG1|nr:beta-galactosidase/beta-glucuronidase [Candidatus Vecturithrix granuli]